MRASLFSGRTNAGRISRSDADRQMRRRKIVAWVVTLIVVCAVTSFSSGNRTGGYGVGSVPKRGPLGDDSADQLREWPR